MSTFIIKAEWIKEVKEGFNSNYNYNYKQYIFNKNYLSSHSIRIPLGTYGRKAMEYSNGQGIKDEYTSVYLDNGISIIKLFEMDMPDARDVQIRTLTQEIKALKEENELLNEKLESIKWKE